MVKVTTVFIFSALACLTSAGPLQRRIAQETSDATAAWESACDNAGGGSQCNPIAVTAAGTLLAAAGPCDQQNSADAMIDLAKTLNNGTEMITLAQIFVQQPRNSPTSLQVPYCRTPPKNVELNGLFHCQFSGSKFPQFSGNDTADDIPLGLTSSVNPPGSCPANPGGPVPDGVQLNTLVTSPGVPVSFVVNNGTNGGAAGGSPTSAPILECLAPVETSGADSSTVATNGPNGGATSSTSSVSASVPTSTPSPTPAPRAAPRAAIALSLEARDSIQQQNVQLAQQANAGFANLTLITGCTSDEGDYYACVGGDFAQCAFGRWLPLPCGAGTICTALPLVDTLGTFVTCTSYADRDARISSAMNS